MNFQKLFMNFLTIFENFQKLFMKMKKEVGIVKWNVKLLL